MYGCNVRPLVMGRGCLLTQVSCPWYWGALWEMEGLWRQSNEERLLFSGGAGVLTSKVKGCKKSNSEITQAEFEVSNSGLTRASDQELSPPCFKIDEEKCLLCISCLDLSHCLLLENCSSFLKCNIFREQCGFDQLLLMSKATYN